MRLEGVMSNLEWSLLPLMVYVTTTETAVPQPVLCVEQVQVCQLF